MLFGLPFACVGVGMAWSLAVTLIDWRQSQSWVARPATILSTDLEKHRSEDGVSYTVAATYRYEFNGEPYTGERVGLATRFESDHYDRRMHAELANLRDREQTTTCYVDPNDPQRAVLDRELRAATVLFHLPFLLGFGLVGFGLIGGNAWSLHAARQRAKRLSETPDKPWLANKAWAAGEWRSGDGKPLAVGAAAAVLWNSICLPISLVFWLDDGPREWWVVLVVGVFSLIGLGLLAGVAWQAARVLQFGRSTLRLAAVPGVVGGEIAGVVLTPENARPDDGFRVTLVCQMTRTTKHGNENQQETITVWEDERIVDQTLTDPSGKRGVPFRFIIPSDAEPTDPDADRPIAWKLLVRASLPGPDYAAEFSAPVFITDQSRPGVVADPSPTTPYEREETLAAGLARQGFRFEETAAGGLRIVSPAFRTPVTTLLLLGMTVLFGGVGVGMWLFVDEWVRWLFGPVFSLVGVTLLFLTLDTLLAATDLEIDGDRWRLRSGWHGLRRLREFAPKNIHAVSLKTSMSSATAGGRTKKWNRINARITAGRTVTLVSGLTDRKIEKRLIAELRRRAKLD